MNIIIKETSGKETLGIIDPKSGVDFIADFIGNTGALTDGQFELVEDTDSYLCSQETYDWWAAVVSKNQLLGYRIHELEQEHGFEAVQVVVAKAGNVDLEDLAGNVNQALDEAFGAEVTEIRTPI